MPNAMTRLIFRRILSGLAGIGLASLLAFLILEAAPGSPIDRLLGDESTLEQRQAIRAELGLDRPLVERYLGYVGGLMHGDMGVSLASGRPVAGLIGQRFANTLLLACLATTLAVCSGYGLGTWAAIHHHGRADLALLVVTAVCLSLPSFGVALLLIDIFAVRLGWLPAVGGGSAWHMLLPCLTLSIPVTAVITRYVRARMIEELRKPYVMTAHAKGLRQRRVWTRHVFKNTLIPSLTLVGVQFSHLLGGAFIVETIFAWPGLGRLTVQAIFDQDMPIVLGAVVLSSIIFQGVNLLVDVAHLWVDPRVREGAG